MAYETAETEANDGIRTLSIVNAILGVWLIITPYWFGYTSGAAKWNQTILGIVVLILAGIRIIAPSQRWTSMVNGIAGIWAIIAPFILSYNRSVAYWNEIIVGILVAYLAFSNYGLSAATRHHHSPA